MFMSNDEICVRYRQAKDKKAQIKILADLNATSKQEIISVLESAGIPLPEKVKQAKPDKPKSQRTFKFDEDLARQLYDQRLMDKEIAERLGVSKTTIFKWRSQYSLPSQKKNPGRTCSKPSCSITEQVAPPDEPITNYCSTTNQYCAEGKLNPVLLKIQKLLDMVSQEDSQKVCGQYLDLMITMLADEVQHITNAK